MPAVIAPFVLARIGAGPARRYFATGERFDAATALRIGLVQEVADDLDEAVGRTVAEILAGAPEAVRLAKRLARLPLSPEETVDWRRRGERAPRARRACVPSSRARARLASRRR